MSGMLRTSVLLIRNLTLQFASSAPGQRDRMVVSGASVLGRANAMIE
jgi:hypothetical protein